MALEQVAILGVVAATLALILARPRGVSEAWVAAGGAAAMLLVSPLALGDLPDVLHETADVLVHLRRVRPVDQVARAGDDHVLGIRILRTGHGLLP